MSGRRLGCIRHWNGEEKKTRNLECINTQSRCIKIPPQDAGHAEARRWLDDRGMIHGDVRHELLPQCNEVTL